NLGTRSSRSSLRFLSVNGTVAMLWRSGGGRRSDASSTAAPGSFPTALRGQTLGTAFHAEEDSSNRAARLRLARSGRGHPSGLRIRVRGRPRRPELGVGVVVVALEPEDSSLPETPDMYSGVGQA